MSEAGTSDAGPIEAAAPDGSFRWRDADRLIRFGPGVSREAPELLAAEVMLPFILLTGSRDGVVPDELAAAAEAVVRVPAGPVPQAAAAAEADAPVSQGLTLVALGGGRVIDVAKALASAHDLAVAAIPTTLSGAEMTGGHRPLPDGRGARPVRPRLVVNDPRLSASQTGSDLAASAMNALGHAMEAFYDPGANPVATMAAARAAELIAGHLEAAVHGPAPEARAPLALGGLLAGYALNETGFGVHHVLCQTIVRMSGAPHAVVNAVMLPHTFRFMLARRPDALAPMVGALAGRDDSAAATVAIESLAALAETTRLSRLGVAEAALPDVAATALRRRELRRMSPHAAHAELVALLEAAV